MAEVRLAAYGDMPEALLRHLVAHGSPQLWALARVLTRYPHSARQAFSKVAIFPSNGRRLSLHQLEPPVYVHPEVDDFWRAVEATGATILRAERADHCLMLLGELGREFKTLASSFLHFSVCPPTQAEAIFLGALAKADRSLPPLALVKGLQVPKRWLDRFCGALDPACGVALDPVPQPALRGQTVGIFRQHPFWDKLLALHSVQPELALSLASRQISLAQGLGTSGDDRLLARLVKQLRARIPTP
jgi:hypothetical protein